MLAESECECEWKCEWVCDAHVSLPTYSHRPPSSIQLTSANVSHPLCRSCSLPYVTRRNSFYLAIFDNNLKLFRVPLPFSFACFAFIIHFRCPAQRFGIDIFFCCFRLLWIWLHYSHRLPTEAVAHRQRFNPKAMHSHTLGNRTRQKFFCQRVKQACAK